jgi:aminoglycoside phosphotransferase (APT) family kinase protein
MQDDPGLIHLQRILNVGHCERDRPSESFIADMQARFPTEREFDRVLTRKQRGRSLPRRTETTLADFASSLDRLLHDKIDGLFEVSDLRWMSGGGSKIQLVFTLAWTDPQSGPTKTKMVVRMEPQESLSATSRLRERQLIEALASIIPVPEVYWVDDEGQWFPEPALIYSFAEGVAKPSEVEGRVGGVGSTFGPHLRSKLAPQFMGHLAKIHTFDINGHDFSAFDVPEVGTTQTALWQLNRARRIWEEDRGEELPMMDVAANWLERNMPTLDRVSALHGDYRSGNFLFDETSGRITAWLDWERGYLGDRHRDLAWITLRQFGVTSEDGKTLLVSGLVPVEQFFEEYERLSGLNVDPDRLHYYRVMNAYQLIASTLGTSYRVARLGRSHQDVLLTWIEGLVYSLADDLRILLEGKR